MAPRLSEGLRQSMIVENRPSANGLVATQYTARAAPDGSVLMMGNALKLQAKVNMTNIHYKGGAQSAIAVMSGEADMVFTSYVVIALHVESGRLRVLGVSSA